MKKTLLLAFLPLFLIACSSSDDDDNGLRKSNYTLNYGQSVDIGADGNLVIDNDFVASYENGKIFGDHIGETDAIYEGSQKITITVNGTSTYLNYPVTDWGASKSTVKSNHKGGSLLSEDSEDIMYTISSGSKVRYIYFYSFENGKLSSSGLAVPSTEASELVDWLSQKYSISMTGDDEIFTAGMDAYSSSKATTFVGIGARNMGGNTYITTYAYLLAFVPMSSSRGTTEDFNTDEMQAKMMKAIREVGLAE